MNRLCFVNGTARKMLLVIEPRSSEFWIKSKSTVELCVEGDSMHLALDVEYLPNGMVIYLDNALNVAVRQDGQPVRPDKQSSRLGRRLTGS